MPQRGPVVINLPTGPNTEWFEPALTRTFRFSVQKHGNAVAVDLQEGSGSVTNYISATRLCGAGEPLPDSTWDPLRALQPVDHDPATVQPLQNWIRDFRAETRPEDKDHFWRQMRAFAADVFVSGRDLPNHLAQWMPGFFAEWTGASLWLITVDDLLRSRMTFLRAQLALTLTPDVPLAPGQFNGFGLLAAHSLTRGGTDFSSTATLPLVMFSPGVIGLQLNWAPHTLVLLFGEAANLHTPDSSTPSMALRPRTMTRPEGWFDSHYWENLTPAEMEPLIPWWVDRLNVLYSHAADPTQFANVLGHHDVSAQAAWFLTMERMLVDTLLLASDPLAPDFVRAQLAFDILDKAEGLLDYTDNGAGFKDLLRRSKTLPRLKQAWEQLPASVPATVGQRLERHGTAVFDGLYRDIRDHVTIPSRLTPRGIKIATTDPATLQAVSMDDYVGDLLRETRNTAHGLKRILREDRTKFIVTSHTGDIPRQVTHLATLITLALVVDAEKLCAGEWW